MRGAALLVCAGALAATVRGPPALEGALVQPAEDGDGPLTPGKGGTLLENEEMASNSPKKFVPG